MKRMKISEAEYEAIKAAEKATKAKRTSQRLRIMMMQYEGKSAAETAKKLGINRSSVYRQYKRYEEEGLEGFTHSKYKGRRPAMPEEQEEEILEQFRKKAEAGQIVTAMEIKRAFDEARGKDTGRGY